MSRKRRQGIILTASAAADQIFANLCHSYHVKYGTLSQQAKRRFVTVFGNFSRNCIFCGENDDDTEKYGELIHSQSGISVHYFCLLFSSGLVQTENEENCNIAKTVSAIYGFNIKNIVLEFARASKLKCNYCHKLGASIGCAYAKCHRKFHYPCGVERQHLYQYFGTFAAYCWEHRPVQTIPRSILSDVRSEQQNCAICFDTIDRNLSFDILTTTCCKNSRIHRTCIQKQALSFGLYLFRCPLCNNSDDYIKEMRHMGVYIPQRDASWETPDAYSDLLESRVMCDVRNCMCEYGRKYDQPGTRWSIKACVICSLLGTHAACASLKHTTSTYVCDICRSVWGEQNLRKKLKEMGFIKEEGMDVKMLTWHENDHVNVMNVGSMVERSTQTHLNDRECDDPPIKRTLRSHVSRMCKTRSAKN